MVEEKKDITAEDVKELMATGENRALTQDEIGILKAKLKDNIETLLSGKCPARIMERERKIQWENTISREGFKTTNDVFKHLTKTTDPEFANDIIVRGAFAISNKSDADKYNIAMQTLADMEPKDSIEAKLCLQAHALWSQGMNYLYNARQNDMIPQVDFYMKNATKLLRLHNETVEALGKYRRGGTQNVIVQHVNVENGGKAIVGNMIAGGGGK